MSKYHTIVTHRSIHLDEVSAVVLLQMYGEAKFPGVRTAVVRYVSDDPIGDDAQFDADGIIPVGVGGGRFDDKDTHGRRKFGVCSTTLVAQCLGIAENPRIRPFLDEVLACDSRPGVRKTQLAGIIKAVNRRFGGDAMQVVSWATVAVHAIVSQLAYNYAPLPGEMGSLRILEELKSHMVNPRALEQVKRYLEDGERNRSATELDFIVRALQRKGMKHNDVFEWTEFALFRLYEDQVAFQESVEEIRPDPRTHRGPVSEEFLVEAEPRNGRRSLRVILIRSDSLNAHEVASYLRYDITVCRRSTGHTQIFTRKGSEARLKHVVAMLRWLDIPKDWKKSKVSWDELTVPGEYGAAPHWHYFQQAEMVFNGTETHTGVKPSGISLDAIKDVLQHAFHGRGIAEWRRQRGIQIERNNTPEVKVSQKKEALQSPAPVAAQNAAPAADQSR